MPRVFSALVVNRLRDQRKVRQHRDQYSDWAVGITRAVDGSYVLRGSNSGWILFRTGEVLPVGGDSNQDNGLVLTLILQIMSDEDAMCRLEGPRKESALLPVTVAEVPAWVNAGLTKGAVFGVAEGHSPPSGRGWQPWLELSRRNVVLGRDRVGVSPRSQMEGRSSALQHAFVESDLYLKVIVGWILDDSSGFLMRKLCLRLI
ncbi:hypothetical protein NE237_021862 [Protea cynaroides]|uniref:Uncharacterized protein n=1 Tax=Protea cynaroides TaxID=273540 RepID=A0A9Q0K3Y5_9MAGN|nr:hypothetical protein NE237_021862 [Protea cynaroides]